MELVESAVAGSEDPVAAFDEDEGEAGGCNDANVVELRSSMRSNTVSLEP